MTDMTEILIPDEVVLAALRAKYGDPELTMEDFDTDGIYQPTLMRAALRAALAKLLVPAGFRYKTEYGYVVTETMAKGGSEQLYALRTPTTVAVDAVREAEVPVKFGIPAEAWEAAAFAFGGPATGEGESYMDCTAWIGYIEQDDGSKVHGLHIACDECPEEGSITLAEFPDTTLAQQPGGRVDGEPVAWLRHSPCGDGYSFASEEVMKDMADWLAPAPPAPVDLGQFRELVTKWRAAGKRAENDIMRSLYPAQELAYGYEAQVYQECADELLALIDKYL